jgi:hypothetical protein
MKVLRFFSILLMITISYLNQVDAQRTCASHQHYINSNQNPSVFKKRQELERKTMQMMKNGMTNQIRTVTTIKVAVHVVMSNPSSVTNAQIQSQIDVLTDDFRASNSDIGTVPPIFQGLTSDTEFEFVLANVGPDCNGITRTVNNTSCFSSQSNDMKSTSSGGHDPIDPEHILNIWVTPLCGGIIGFATFPGEPLATDGVVIAPSAFGLGGTSQAPFNLGRTATHEVGHYFNLFHIWGDDTNPNDGIGDCEGSDQCQDTPNQEHQNYGCPSFPHVTCNNGPSGDMFMNYMDYVDDDCMHMFTPNQSTRMQVALMNARPGLLAISSVEVCCSIKNIKPNLSDNQVSSECNKGNIDLTQYLIGQIPSGATLIWSTDNDPSNGVSPVISGNVNTSGTYFGYFMNSEGNCFSIPSNAIVVAISPICSLTDMVVTQNSSIQSNSIFRSITVKPNATLTISGSQVQIVDKIAVEMGGKLIIDESTLTNCSTCPDWKGVKVSADLGYWWGAPPTTIVEVKNGGIIENADTAIDAVGQVTIFTTSNVGGAKITVSSNSIIRNCEYGIKLGPLYGVQEFSSCTNSQFTNVDFAINLENNHGFNLKKCQFSDCYADIRANTSSLFADDNDFNGEVVFENTFPNFTGSTFINNRFYGGTVGSSYILLDAYSNATDFNIHNNQFFETGVVSLGELDFDIQSNDFHDSPEGTWINDSGLNITNDIHRNKFFDNTYGNSASGVNSVEYLKNCFENTEEFSIEVNEGASIGLQQGFVDNAAGNCFFASGRVGTGQTSEFFDYFVKSGEIPQSCKKPGSGNFYELTANDDIQITCGTGINIYGTLPYIVRNCMYGNGISKQQAINLLKAEILRIQNDTNLNPWTQRWLIAKYKKCLDRLIKQKANEEKDQSGRESAVQFLLSQPEFRYQSMAYGLVLESGDITRSRTMLNNLSPGDIGETEFVQSQHVLLDYLSDRSGYNAPSISLSALYTAGLRKHPLAGFSRSVYHTLTGQKVPVTLTHLSGRTQTKTKASANEMFFYPNPSYAGDIIIDIPDYDYNHVYSYSIQSASGLIVNQGLLSQKVSDLYLDVSSGVYFVSLIQGGKHINTQKWIVIR